MNNKKSDDVFLIKPLDNYLNKRNLIKYNKYYHSKRQSLQSLKFKNTKPIRTHILNTQQKKKKITHFKRFPSKDFISHLEFVDFPQLIIRTNCNFIQNLVEAQKSIRKASSKQNKLKQIQLILLKKHRNNTQNQVFIISQPLLLQKKKKKKSPKFCHKMKDIVIKTQDKQKKQIIDGWKKQNNDNYLQDLQQIIKRKPL